MDKNGKGFLYYFKRFFLFLNEVMLNSAEAFLSSSKKKTHKAQ